MLAHFGRRQGSSAAPTGLERTVAEATETNNPGISGAHNVARPRE
jgi:hypothetical protein